MIDFVGASPFCRIAICVAMETMHLHIARLIFIMRTKRLCIHGVLKNNLPPIKTCPGVGEQGRSY